MLQKIMIAFSLMAASAGALAHGGYVYPSAVTVAPNISISYGSGSYNGYRILYESGSRHYWSYTNYPPSQVIWVPGPPMHHGHHHKHHKSCHKSNQGFIGDYGHHCR